MAQEGASNGLLEFIEERLRARGRELFPQRVDFGERGAQQPVSLCFLPRFVQLKTSRKYPPRRTELSPLIADSPRSQIIASLLAQGEINR